MPPATSRRRKYVPVCDRPDDPPLTPRAQTYPALFGLYRMGFLPRDVKIVGYARTKMDTAEYHKRITSYLKVADDDDDADDGFETVGKGGKANVYSAEGILKNLAAIQEARGKKVCIPSTHHLIKTCILIMRIEHRPRRPDPRARKAAGRRGDAVPAHPRPLGPHFFPF